MSSRAQVYRFVEVYRLVIPHMGCYGPNSTEEIVVFYR